MSGSSSSTPRPTYEQVKQIAEVAVVHPDTVTRRLAGGPVRPGSKKRIDDALRSAGFAWLVRELP